MNTKTLIFLLTITTFACTSEFLDYQDPMSNQIDYLSFESVGDFENKIGELKELLDEEFLELEANNGFKSLRGLYVEVLKAEDHFFKEILKDIDLSDISEYEAEGLRQLQSPILLENAKSLHFFDDRGFTMNVYRSEMGSVLNKDGIVKIGNNLLRFTYDEVRQIDLSNTKVEMARNLLLSESSDSKMFNAFQVNHKIFKTGELSNAREQLDSCIEEVDNLRITGRVYISSVANPNLGSGFATSTLEVYAKRNRFGLYNTGRISIDVEYRIFNYPSTNLIPQIGLFGCKSCHQRNWTVATQDWRVPMAQATLGPGMAIFEARSSFGPQPDDEVRPTCTATWD